MRKKIQEIERLLTECHNELARHNDVEGASRVVKKGLTQLKVIDNFIEHERQNTSNFSTSENETVAHLEVTNKADELDFGSLTKPKRAQVRDYAIFYFIKNSGKRAVTIDDVFNVLVFIGLEMQRNSLVTKLNRWKNPEKNSDEVEPHNPYVTWGDLKKITMTPDGDTRMDELSNAMEDIDRNGLEELVAAFK